MSLTQKIKELLYYTPVNPYFIAKSNLRKAMKYSAHYVTGTVIDIGCGKKPYKRYFSNVSLYVGIDYPSSLKSFDDHIDVVGDGQQLPIRSGIADTVLCNQVLEHIPDTVRFINNLSFILKSGSYLILTVPFFWGLHEEPRDFYRFTKYGLEYLFHNNGFYIVEIKKFGGIFGTIFQRLSDLTFIKFRALFGFPVSLIIIPLTFLFQICGFLLDVIFAHKGDNLDWLLIARKK